jgi:two-component system, NtrC family, response regulator AtoC
MIERTDPMTASLDVLIMEDDSTIRLALAHALKSRGAHVEIYSSLEGALTAIHARAFDVILADLSMQGQDGVEGLELLKVVEAIHPETRVIIMTAYGTDEVEIEIAFHGGAYWAKSRDLDELVGSVLSRSSRPARI